ncbi:hypothetical protein, partial [Burkholderia thailandensis]|uniref:hypothetical protein n=1 Tax=Burkholderia thailandensis TaxID=57975 RepID=UPI00217DF601
QELRSTVSKTPAREHAGTGICLMTKCSQKAIAVPDGPSRQVLRLPSRGGTSSPGRKVGRVWR